MMTSSTPFTLPRRFVIRPAVSSPLTCRHPKHIRCACHGQPISSTQGKAESKSTATAATNIQQLESHFQTLLAQIGRVLLRFPEAKDAVNQVLRELRASTHSPTSAHPAEVP